jgi:hypothetical protein
MEVDLRNTAKWLIAGLAIIFFIGQSQTFAANSNFQDSSELKEIRYHKVGEQLEVAIKVQGKFGFEIFELHSPNRLVLDLSSVEKISSLPSLQVNDLGVLTIRVGQFEPKLARVVFDLDEKSPFHRISQVEEGLRVIFWAEAAPAQPPAVVETPKKEEAAAPVIKAEVKEPATKEILKESTGTKIAAEKKVEKAAKEVPERPEKGRGFFLRVGGGVVLPLASATQIQKNFNLYGEVGSIKESYKLSVSSLLELGFGRYFQMGEKEIKAGIGLGYNQIKYKGTLDLSVPHPFIPNNPRTVTSTDSLKDKLYYFYLFGLYPVIGGEKFNVYLGPILGFASGKFLSLQDFSITDNPPHGNSDVTVTDKTYVEDSISSLLLGGQANLEYSISPRLSLDLDGRMIYVNPNIKNLAQNANLTQIQFVLGLKYHF